MLKLVIEKIKNFKTSRDWLTQKLKKQAQKWMAMVAVKSKETRLLATIRHTLISTFG